MDDKYIKYLFAMSSGEENNAEAVYGDSDDEVGRQSIVSGNPPANYGHEDPVQKHPVTTVHTEQAENEESDVVETHDPQPAQLTGQEVPVDIPVEVHEQLPEQVVENIPIKEQQEKNSSTNGIQATDEVAVAHEVTQQTEEVFPQMDMNENEKTGEIQTIFKAEMKELIDPAQEQFEPEIPSRTQTVAQTPSLVVPHPEQQILSVPHDTLPANLSEPEAKLEHIIEQTDHLEHVSIPVGSLGHLQAQLEPQILKAESIEEAKDSAHLQFKQVESTQEIAPLRNSASNRSITDSDMRQISNQKAFGNPIIQTIPQIDKFEEVPVLSIPQSYDLHAEHQLVQKIQPSDVPHLEELKTKSSPSSKGKPVLIELETKKSENNSFVFHPEPVVVESTSEATGQLLTDNVQPKLLPQKVQTRKKSFEKQEYVEVKNTEMSREELMEQPKKKAMNKSITKDMEDNPRPKKETTDNSGMSRSCTCIIM